MKVLIIVRSLRIGGLERVAVNLSDAFAEMGHSVHLLAMKKAKQQLRPENESVVVHQVDFDLINRLTVIGFIYDLLTRGLINLIYRRSMFIWRGIYTTLYFRLWLRHVEKRAGRFDLIIVRGQGSFEYLWPFKDPRLVIFMENVITEHSPVNRRKLFASCLFKGKNIACVSTGVKRNIDEVVNKFKIDVQSIRIFPNPCPIDRIRMLSRADDPSIPDEPYIVNVSRLVPQKNHRLLIDAYARLDIPEKLVIVGDGSEEANLRTYVHKLGLDNRVIFAGSKVNPYPWMRKARLFVLSSNFEGFGVVLVESMACGTPVVSVDCPGGIRDVLVEEQSEYLVPADPKLLAEMIRYALESPPVIKDEWVTRFDARTIADSIIREYSS